MPFNNGVRKPFASGGIEWNWGGGRGQIGHSVFSEEPAFVARVSDVEGDHVRIYEYDRFNGTLWQVDILLPNSTSPASRAAWFHVKVTNPNPHQTRGYWWSNTAVHTTKAGRVISPARAVAESGVCPAGGMSCAPFPHYTDECGARADKPALFLNRSKGHTYDHSVIGNLISGRDAFLRTYEGDESVPAQGLYVAHVDKEVYGSAVGSFHGATGDSPVENFGMAPNGTKYFVYPNDEQGQFWQDWLSGTRDGSKRGNYVELQIGPAPSQMQTFTMPAGESIEWTEYIMGMQGANVSELHGLDYARAVNAVKGFLQSAGGMPKEVVKQMHQKMKRMATNLFPTLDSRTLILILMLNEGWPTIGSPPLLSFDQECLGVLWLSFSPGSLSHSRLPTSTLAGKGTHSSDHGSSSTETVSSRSKPLQHQFLHPSCWRRPGYSGSRRVGTHGLEVC